MNFKSKQPAYEYLRKKWLAKHRQLQNKLWEKHGQSFKSLAIGSVSGLLLLTSPAMAALPSPEKTFSRDDIANDLDKNIFLATQLKDKVPKEIRPLTLDEEGEIINILTKSFDLKISVKLSGIRLNRNYGLIGGEQHLYRYPGDNLYSHANSASDWAMYGPAGMAPNLGAWGYFAPSKTVFTKEDEEKERYYLAIQTFLVAGYAENVDKFRDFFKFRKMLVVNPKSGRSVVAVIGDAGPSSWTGKHLGGSPEVMDALGLANGPRKGSVLYFFIDDVDDKIPLGPIKVKGENI